MGHTVPFTKLKKPFIYIVITSHSTENSNHYNGVWPFLPVKPLLLKSRPLPTSWLHRILRSETAAQRTAVKVKKDSQRVPMFVLYSICCLCCWFERKKREWGAGHAMAEQKEKYKKPLEKVFLKSTAAPAAKQWFQNRNIAVEQQFLISTPGLSHWQNWHSPPTPASMILQCLLSHFRPQWHWT